ncbi:hypothetical protein H6P81_010550 [Aristolochia fimbriata]|uniref:Uncharacterized protein n=1 Tax=Aristolochia fimbriata TaxID=158543 RepID=A0AAV7EP26_ARIFI|nr:hypothetical protein H6P81_010550 [Aristolochia fimbriata]
MAGSKPLGISETGKTDCKLTIPKLPFHILIPEWRSQLANTSSCSYYARNGGHLFSGKQRPCTATGRNFVTMLACIA